MCLEDSVLSAIIAISEGMDPEQVIDALYIELLSMEKDLLEDNEALNWFKLEVPSVGHSLPSTSETLPSVIPSPPLTSEFPSTPMTGVSPYFKFIMILFSHPISRAVISS